MKVSVIPVKRSPITHCIVMQGLPGAGEWYDCETCGQRSPDIVDRKSFMAAQEWRAAHPCPSIDTVGIGLS